MDMILILSLLISDLFMGPSHVLVPDDACLLSIK